MRNLIILVLVPVLFGSACVVGEDEAADSTSGVSVGTIGRGLTGCQGQASSTVPTDNRYVITTFGGPGDHQSMSCGGFADGTGWYAASRQRYGCGTRLKVEANGKCVVVATDDYGPDVCVERAAEMPILDVSPKVARALFNISGAGWSDHEIVTAEPVSAGTPLGPCVATDGGGGGGGGTGGGTPTPTTCASSTLDRDVTEGTCVQSADDSAWYSCQAGAWVATPSSAGCATAFGFCESATLGTAVPARTCVQARSDSKWYQCNGTGWVTPVAVATEMGPIGTCSTMNPL